MKVLKITLAAFLLLGATSLSADAKKGQNIYLKKLKKKCGMKGDKFAHSFQQEQLEDAKDDGTLNELFIEVCPKAKNIIESDKFQEKFKDHIYDFAHEYAEDSGNVPSC
jgi:hypothetical protein